MVAAGLITPAEFWHGDHSMLKYYRAAYRKKEEHENYLAWLQGLYVYEAICDASPILRPFTKARKPIPYPEKPYEPEQPTEEESRAEKERKAYENNKVKFEALAIAANAQFSKKKKVNPNGG